MVNKPKQIGTASETKVVRYLLANGFAQAERRALRGIRDVGDITGTPGIVWEVKGGDAARWASDNQVDLWLAETELERSNAREHLGILVVARHMKSAGDWWAVLWADQLVWLISGESHNQLADADRTPVRTTLRHLVDLLRAGGWGDPIDSEETPA